MTRDAVPSMDLRLSEFAPDREAATARWAEHELQRQKNESKAQREAVEELDRKYWEDRKDRLVDQRVEAVKRGEIYRPPARAPRPAALSATYGYGATGAYYPYP